MSTNYYLHRHIPRKTLQKIKSLVSDEFIYNGQLQQILDDFKPIHIGKASAGWQFCFDHNDWKYYDKTKKSIRTFIINELLEGGQLVDEYGKPTTLVRLWDIVEKNKDGLNSKTNYELERKEWEEYQLNPEKFTDRYFKPHPPSTLELQYPDILTDEGLRFAYSTDFC